MAVGLETVALAPDDHAELGVGLPFDEAEDDVDARALHGAGPAQIGLLVEAGLDLDEGGDVLAVLGRLDQGGDDGAVLGGPVQGLFDGDDVGIAGGLAQELDHHVEALERVVDQHVLLADRREDVAAVVADAFRIARLVALELQLRVARGNELRQLGEAQHAVDQNDVLRCRVQLVGDEGAQIVGHGGLDLDPHDRAEAALLQGLLELHDEVLGLFLDLDVAVADQTEDAALQYVAAREQVVDEEHQQALQRQIAFAPRGRATVGGQRPEALHLGRHGDEGVEGAVVRPPLQLQRQREAEVGQEGEGVGRVDRHRRQHGEQLVQELGLQPLALGLGDAGGVDDLDPDACQFLAQLAPAALLFGHQPAGGHIDLVQLLGRGQAVGGEDAHPFTDLALEAGDPGHEEFIEVVGRDRQEAQPLQQRVGRIGGLFQHPAVERQPGNLAVEEARRRGHQGLGQLKLGRARGRDLLAGGRVADRRIAHVTGSGPARRWPQPCSDNGKRRPTRGSDGVSSVY